MGGSRRNGGVKGWKEVCSSLRCENFMIFSFHRTSVYEG